MPGRGMGERLAIDPRNSEIIYFGARSGNGLWKSVDQGVTFQRVTSFTAVGTYQADATDMSGYSNDIDGLATVTFDSTSSLKNGASSVIYVGTADKNASIWVSRDAGITWSAMAGQPIGVFPHQVKFSKSEKKLYITYNSDSGPYSGGTGSVYSVSQSGTFTNITPPWATVNSISFGYGGLALDAQNPGTLMVSSLNLWYPDVQIFRSTNSGKTWAQIWDWVNGTRTNYYTQDTDKAPWINNQRLASETKVLGWMVEALEIDPFDSDHLLYGTGLTIYGSRNLQTFPEVHVSALADGIEETAVQALITPPGTGIPLLSGVSDNCGYVHTNLDKAPNNSFVNPLWQTTNGLDYAGLKPKNIARIGGGQLATSSDIGASWTISTAVPDGASGGSIAYAADASVLLWTSSAGSLRVANSTSTVVATLSSGAAVVADKVNPKYFYAASTTSFLVSLDAGKTFAPTFNLTSTSTPKLAAHPAIAGVVWLSTSAGLYHSTDFGLTFTKSPNVTAGNAVAIGKGEGKGTNVYSFNTMGGEPALRVSNDDGKSWKVISDTSHGFGAQGANVLAASWEIQGRVYVGTNGRGVFYGSP